MSDKLQAIGLSIFILVGCWAAAMNHNVHAEPESRPPLTIAADALAKLTEEPTLHSTPNVPYHPETVDSILRPFADITSSGNTSSTTIEVTILKEWKDCKTPLDQQFECSHDGKTYRTKWEEVKK